MRMTMLTTASVFALAGAAHANIEVIFTEIDGHPTSIVPGAQDLAGSPVPTEFKAMELLSVSPDGSQWMLKARNELGSDLETMMLIGSGLTGEMLAQEGQPIPTSAAGELWEFFGSGPPRFNDLNEAVFTARARGGVAANAQKGIHWDGVSLSVILEQGDKVTGLADLVPNPSGDELLGNSFGSLHLLNDGSTGMQDTTIQNIHSSRRPALFYDVAAFKQVGVDTIGISIWDDFDSNDFRTTPDGSRWSTLGEDLSLSGPDILVVDDVVVLREGETAGKGGPVIDAIFAHDLIGNGDWYARGDDAGNDDWAVRNGELIAVTGGTVPADVVSTWGAVILAATGNRNGDFIVAGRLASGDTATDDLVVLNNERVVLREGDPVDLDGNGMFDDDVFIGRGNDALTALQADDMFLTDDGYIYALVELRDGAGNDLGTFGTGGDALIRVDTNLCVWDLSGDSSVGFADLTMLLADWGPCGDPCPGDFDMSGTVGFSDLTELLANWGPC